VPPHGMSMLWTVECRNVCGFSREGRCCPQNITDGENHGQGRVIAGNRMGTVTRRINITSKSNSIIEHSKEWHGVFYQPYSVTSGSGSGSVAFRRPSLGLFGIH
jgi:hypothetical protein